MSRFLENAERIFEAAAEATRCCPSASDLSILIHREGGIRMIMDGGWTAPALLADSGASMVYRVSHDAGKVRVEGRSGQASCLFETESPAAVASRLLAPDPICYALHPSAAGAKLLCLPPHCLQ